MKKLLTCGAILTTILTGCVSADFFYDSLLEEVDTNKNGSISKAEYIASWKKDTQGQTRAEVEKEFKTFDVNNDGKIERAEFNKVFSGK
ncbi:hypothetical protein A3K86_15710 [Photobacterium jeanii]|uniref:EF-hand domain-containing protein n=1 Tax=Photobacterium jeanii TaxID=858640 RepID=A0A178K6Y7_9GAMM|nr:EF-hand domain-containing protein [Photobacterium jeanii]OAN13109.1 hypothetical protein A3K86_15710 [Photobacterium jeanii]PST89259.1 EF-hand domain-containing protein [Photobacterium jeanii]